MDRNLGAFVSLIQQRRLNLYGALVYQHGAPVGAYHWVNDQPFHMYSLSKSFASTLIGMAIEEGLLSLDSRPVDLLADKLPDAPDEKLQRLTLKHLLTMASGHGQPYLLATQRDELRTKDWVLHYLAQPLVHEPGERFVYDTGDTYIASAMLQRAAGETMLSYAKDRLFAPLGIPYPRWDACPQGITLGGAGLYLTLQDTAKLGLLYLNRGQWDGRQLVAEEWVETASRKHIETADAPPQHDGHYGYGFQFWRGRHDSYRADGAFGQFCLILPRVDAVIAIHSRELADAMGILDAVWDTLLPELEGGA